VKTYSSLMFEQSNREEEVRNSACRLFIADTNWRPHIINLAHPAAIQNYIDHRRTWTQHLHLVIYSSEHQESRAHDDHRLPRRSRSKEPLIQREELGPWRGYYPGPGKWHGRRRRGGHEGNLVLRTRQLQPHAELIAENQIVKSDGEWGNVERMTVPTRWYPTRCGRIYSMLFDKYLIK
jgi:hypothetical protein